MMVASRLRELRQKKEYTQVQIQHITGIDQSDFSKIENETRCLTFEKCKRLALALDTTMGYLAALTDEKKPYPRAKGAENLLN